MRSTMLTREDYDKMIDKIMLCGRNRGPHDYIPMSWDKQKDYEAVSMVMCRVCLNRVSVKTLAEHFPEIKLDQI